MVYSDPCGRTLQQLTDLLGDSAQVEVLKKFIQDLRPTVHGPWDLQVDKISPSV
jgi:hypothetical protein